MILVTEPNHYSLTVQIDLVYLLKKYFWQKLFFRKQVFLGSFSYPDLKTWSHVVTFILIVFIYCTWTCRQVPQRLRKSLEKFNFEICGFFGNEGTWRVGLWRKSRAQLALWSAGEKGSKDLHFYLPTGTTQKLLNQGSVFCGRGVEFYTSTRRRIEDREKSSMIKIDLAQRHWMVQ